MLFAPCRCSVDRVTAQVLAAGRAARATSSTWATACLPDADPEVLARVVERVHEGPTEPHDLDGATDGRRRRGRASRGCRGLAAGPAPRPPRVVVLEQSARVGGKLLVGAVGEVEVDLGAESVLARRPEALELFADLGLGADVVHPATAAAKVVRNGVAHPLPTGTVMGVPGRPEVLADVLTPAEIERVAAEPSPPPALAGGRPDGPSDRRAVADVDVASFVAGRLGTAVVDRLVEPLLGGVYAGRADRLSLRATVPALWDVARSGEPLLAAVRRMTAQAGAGADERPRPVFAGLRGGLGRLPLRLAERLGALGVEVRTGVTVRELHRRPAGWRAGHGRRAVAGGGRGRRRRARGPAGARGPACCARRSRCAARELAGVSTASVALVAALLPRPQVAGLSGSGLLVPPIEGRAVKAATYASNKWAWVDELAPGLAVVRASLGRAGEEAVLQRDDADLARLALADLGDLLGRELRPVAVRVVRWGGGLPQPAVGHVDAMERAVAAVAAVPGWRSRARPWAASASPPASPRRRGRRTRCWPGAAGCGGRAARKNAGHDAARRPHRSLPVARDQRDHPLHDVVRVRARPGGRAPARGPRALAAEAEQSVAGLAGKDLVVRGWYDVAGLRADADLMVWWHAPDVETVQQAYRALRRTALGRHLRPVWSVVGLHRPAEFNKAHVPAFMAGEAPRGYVSVYPFVRSYEWYLLPEDERRRLLVEHGRMARPYPDVRANTVAPSP